MALAAEFLNAAALAADGVPGPLMLPWPMPGNLGGLVPFATFAEWRTFMLKLGLRDGIPELVTAKFARAHKLYVLAWVDFDLIKAGELVALTALELALTERYGGKERERRRQVIEERASEKERRPTPAKSDGLSKCPSPIC